MFHTRAIRISFSRADVKEFYDRYDPEELLKEVGMTTEQILADIKKILD